jgi:prepilin-type processing-associated H-X9-DG protein/prepilin-type N-terminal cleavage/methylation domain-containing protein
LCPGFTLVELLVVIGIIALLISMLLPGLTMARRSAQRTACSAKLHQVMLAAQLHRNNHGDYYPIAGLLPGTTPETLDDPYATKYDYFSYQYGAAPRQLCPITNSLETMMSGSKAINAKTGIIGVPNENGRDAVMLDPRGLTANFVCPAQAGSPLDIIPQFVFMYYSPSSGMSLMEPQSYCFNEYVVGYQDSLGHLRGKAGMVRKPDMTVFAADGLGGSNSASHGGCVVPNGLYTFYNMTTASPVSLADALTNHAGYAGDSVCFDKIRHGGKINIAFCDGHVESRNLTANDLASVWIVAP